MKKKHFIIVGVVVVIAIGLYFFIFFDKPSSKEAALEAFRNYKPTTACTDDYAPLIHKASGATAHGSSSCLPPGWEVDR